MLAPGRGGGEGGNCECPSLCELGYDAVCDNYD